MASAESQGKTIALVIVIVLFVAASGTAFYFYDKVAGADLQKTEALKKASDSDSNYRKEQANYSEIRQVLTGQAGTSDDHAKIIDAAKEKLVNPNRDPVSKRKDRTQLKQGFDNFFAALDTNYAYVKANQNEVAATEGELAKQTDGLAKVTKIYDAKLDEANQATAKKAAELKEQMDIAAKTIEERNSQVDVAQLRFAQKATEFDQLKRNSEALVDDLNSQIAKMTLLMDKARQRQLRGQDVRFNIEDGEIVQIQGGGAEAYINIGRADGVGEGLTFGIYGIDRSGFTQNLPKANFEVTRILADHRALGRILDFQVSQPVIPGDKIFNPVWDRGQKTGVALLGIIDMDGDSAPDNEEFKRLIERWGGTIDAEVDLKTFKITGRITTETDWLVEGRIPEPAEAGDVEASDAPAIRNAILAASTKFRKDAQINGVRSVNINNFLAYMGYRPIRKTQMPGEEDIYRETKHKQKTRRIEPNPGDVAETDEMIDVERVRKDAARAKGAKKGGDKSAEKPAAKPAKKKDEDAEKDMEADDKGKKEEKKKDDKKGKKSDDDFG